MSTATQKSRPAPPEKPAVQRTVKNTRRAVKRNLAKPLRMVTSPVRRLPDFLIIGAQKGGTTSLYEYLKQHPRICPAFEKEVRFFDLNYARGLNWYRAHFPANPYVYFRRQLHRQPLVTGEATPQYLFHPLVPKRVHETVPRARLIVLLRNPADRAYSHYQHEVRARRETLSFEEALDQEDVRLAGERERLLSDENYPALNLRRYSYLARGIYFDQLRAWLELFPRENVLIQSSEELFEDPALVFDRVTEFLGLPPVQLEHYVKRNVGRYESGMDSATRRYLSEYFRPHNQRLYEYLGRDFGWKD